MENVLIEDYLNYLKYNRKLSDNTIKSYKYSLYKFNLYIKKDLSKVKVDDINNYIKKISNLSNRSINHEITVIKEFFKYESRKNNFNNPSKLIGSRKLSKTLPKYLTIEEVDKLLDIDLKNKYDYRNKAMLELMYACGLRVSEIINIKINEIDYVNAIVKVNGKGNKERIVPISDIALKYNNIYVNEYRNELIPKNKNSNEYLYLNNHGEKISRVSFDKIIKKLAKNKNILKEVSPHILRHSFATHLIEGGADVRSVQLLLGHENITTTEIYTHLNNDFIKKNYFEYNPRAKKEE